MQVLLRRATPRPGGRTARCLLAVFSAVGLMLVLPACGDDGGSSAGTDGAATRSVDATLREYKIELSTSTVSAGAVTFNARNKGSIAHELVVIRSDLDSGALPERGGIVPEDEVEVIDEIAEFDPGTTQSATFDLAPGAYVLICNIPGHYGLGMHTSLTVKA